MTNAMLFEGADLEEVLAEARLCFGPQVEIEAANRVRRGGMLGFFASEWFEVWARSPQQTTNAAIAMLDREDSLERDDADSFHAMVRNAFEDRTAEGDPSAGGGATSESSRLDTVMDQFFGDEFTPSSSEPAAQSPRLAGVALAERDEPAPAPSAATRSSVVDAPAEPAPEVVAAPSPAPSHSPALAPAMIPAAVALEDAPRGTSVFETTRAPRTDLLWAMLDRLDTAPRAPELPTSGVVAFVGDVSTALEAVQRIGTRTGLWSKEIAVMTRHDEIEGVPSWLIINDFDELTTRTTRWRQRDTVVPVIIDQGIEATDRHWAAGALVALDPDQVRMVTETWRLPDDVGRLAAKLGGIDAIDLVAVADSVEPLAMLDLDIPVSTIEGRDASAELLAAVWLENRRRV